MDKIVVFSILVVFIFVIIFGYRYYQKTSIQDVENLLDLFFYYTTIEHNPNDVSNLFCENASLLATVSPEKRKGLQILEYFNYFCNLPGLRILENIKRVHQVEGNVFLATCFVTWYWDDLTEPLLTRMSFVIHKNCIFQLHSSQLPIPPKELE